MPNIIEIAVSLVIEALALAPPSPTVVSLTPEGSLATILRQLGAIAGIASERARTGLYKAEWLWVESVTLLACFALERHVDGDTSGAMRMLNMAGDRLGTMHQMKEQEAVA